MRDELEQKLAEDFPFMKRNPSGESIKKITNIYQKWGCQCGDGWYKMIHDLCQEITDRYEKDGIPVDIVVEQIKEKFASLRFYYSYPDSPPAFHALDFLGGSSIRLYPESDNDEHKGLRKDIAEIVRKYEELSRTVCEICGEKGEARMDLRWKRTLCDSCYEKQLKKTN